MLNLNLNNTEETKEEFLTCWDIFKSRPNNFMVYDNMYNWSDVSNMGLDILNIWGEINPSGIINKKILCKVTDNILLSLFVLNSEGNRPIATDLTLYFRDPSDWDSVNDFISKLNRHKIDDIDINTDSGLNLLTIMNNSFVEIPIPSEGDSNGFLAKKTQKSLSKLEKRLKNEFGIHIVYGDAGMGKTTALKNMLSDIDKKSFFIPNSILEQTILHPEFTNFLINNPNSIIVMDDFEMLYDYYGRYNSILMTLSQLTNSMYSHILNLNIIIIINSDKKSELESILDVVDANVIKFDTLNAEEVAILSEKIGLKTKLTGGKLSDVLNGTEVNKKRIGF